MASVTIKDVGPSAGSRLTSTTEKVSAPWRTARPSQKYVEAVTVPPTLKRWQLLRPQLMPMNQSK